MEIENGSRESRERRFSYIRWSFEDYSYVRVGRIDIFIEESEKSWLERWE